MNIWKTAGRLFFSFVTSHLTSLLFLSISRAWGERVRPTSSNFRDRLGNSSVNLLTLLRRLFGGFSEVLVNTRIGSGLGYFQLLTTLPKRNVSTPISVVVIVVVVKFVLGTEKFK